MIWQTTLLLAFASALYSSTVVDRIAVIVGKHVIKSSDIDRDLRVTEFLNRQQPNFGSDAKHKSAERLIDQVIIGDEIANGGYARLTDADAEALLKQLRQDRFAGSDARQREALSLYGLTEDHLRAQLLWQLEVLRFIDQRFRPGVLVTDEEVRTYYDEHRADLRREYPQANSLEALGPKIRTSLEGERINQNFVQWLDQARKRNRIEYRQGAFQ
jgi:peptidyl-prolyl cis-trans isomerase SurA